MVPLVGLGSGNAIGDLTVAAYRRGQGASRAFAHSDRYWTRPEAANTARCVGNGEAAVAHPTLLRIEPEPSARLRQQRELARRGHLRGAGGERGRVVAAEAAGGEMRTRRVAL